MLTVCVLLQLNQLGLLPEGDADPVVLAEKLTQLAIDANDEEVGCQLRLNRNLGREAATAS